MNDLFPLDKSELISMSCDGLDFRGFVSLMEPRLSTTAVELSIWEDVARRGYFCNIAVSLYGLDSDKVTELPAIDSDYTSVAVPDPSDPPRMPATWWSHLMFSIGDSLIHFVSRRSRKSGGKPHRWLFRVGMWFMDRCKWVTLPVATMPFRVRAVRRLQRRFVCPHIGLSVNNARHINFISSGVKSSDFFSHMAIERIMATLDDGPASLSGGCDEAASKLQHIRMIIEHCRRMSDASI